MNLLSKIIAAVTYPGKPEGTEEAKRRSDKRIVRDHSNGNIRLQRGEYTTRAEIDNQNARVQRHDFNPA